MISQIGQNHLTYIASTGDWVARIVTDGKTISIIFESNVGTMEMASGINYDNLATFIAEVKIDVIARGYNWSGN